MPKKSADKLTRAAIIVAAGKGVRAGGDVPKQYQMLSGEPVLAYTYHALATFGFDIIVLVHADGDARWKALALEGVLPVIGGDTRTESVRNGLEALKPYAPHHVFIHDGARPGVDSELLSRLAEALQTHRAVAPALPIVDAVKIGDDATLGPGVDRRTLRRVQTPQAFHYTTILEAYASAHGDFPDDVAVATAAGIEVASVPGSEDNFKITHAEDFAKMERRIGKSATRLAVGTGYDVHQTCEGDHVWLCGVKVDAPFGLLGHSDADIGLHALVDAILGALAEGDIGDHFPPSDPQWKGAESWKFLQFCKERVVARNGTIQHVDVTLICEAPKVKPHRDGMRTKIADILDLGLHQVGLKATTTERLGFTGRGEGLAAQAVASLELPR